MKAVRYKSALGVVCLMALLVLANIPRVNGGTWWRLSISYVWYPLLQCQYWCTRPFVHWWSSYQAQKSSTLVADYTFACAERDRLRAENIQLRAQQHQYESIKELIAFSKRYEVCNAHVVTVLMRCFGPTEHFFLVDAGSRHGIKRDMIALYENCLVGRVVEVYPWYSKVLLITDKTCKVAVEGQLHHAPGIYEGCAYTTQSIVRYVNKLNEVEENELFISTGQGLIFPRGFCVGRMKAIHDVGLYNTVDIVPVLDFKTITSCVLIEQ